MRHYQCAIDNSTINRGKDYNNFPDAFIIFLCTFDSLQAGLPLYTIMPACREMESVFKDGTIKVIVNSKAEKKTEANHKVFLSYMNGEAPQTEFTEHFENG